MQHTVIGIFGSQEEAKRAVDQLASSGISQSNIDIVSGHGESGTSLDSDSPYGVSDESRYDQEQRSRGDRDVLNQDRIDDRKDREEFDEGIGDSIGRFFRNLFDNREEAEKYASAGRRNSIVSVHASSNEEAVKAANLLDQAGAIDIDERALDTGSYTSASQRKSREITDRDDRLPHGESTDKSIPVIEENVNIDKRQVESGSVKVRSRIVEKPIEEHMRLREEHIYVERNPANRPATEQDLNTFREGEVELSETREVPVVDKEARVVEEVRLRREVKEHDETVRDTVKKTEIDVDKREGKDLGDRERDRI